VIVRILNEGQWDVGNHLVAELNGLDDAVERAVKAGDQALLASALSSLLDKVRNAGSQIPDDELRDSDLILPDADATLDDVRALLAESEEGLIPGCHAGSGRDRHDRLAVVGTRRCTAGHRVARGGRDGGSAGRGGSRLRGRRG